MIRSIKSIALSSILLFSMGLPMACGQTDNAWLQFEGDEGPGKGKHIVLVSGDEEYRSEEALPMLAKVLAKQGFTTTVLFAIDPGTGLINPDYQENIPGLNMLETADLLILFTRFRELPDEQMKFIDDYLLSGKPIIGLRTATHAFFYQDNPESAYAHYSWNSKVPGWEGGFGRRVLGETWVDHHGKHGEEGTRGLVDGIRQREDHPVLQGISDIWCATDVYGTRALPDNAEVLVWGQSTRGMNPAAPVNWSKSVMPVAWTKPYQLDNGEEGTAFTTTMGASVDLSSEDLRRLLVNASYWLLSIPVPSSVDVGLPAGYSPTMFGFGEYQPGLKVSDLK